MSNALVRYRTRSLVDLPHLQPNECNHANIEIAGAAGRCMARAPTDTAVEFAGIIYRQVASVVPAAIANLPSHENDKRYPPCWLFDL
ncbi:hypothetical protein [Rhizobium leguminosarum]|uniref:Uncharacterized protein n=1 Tax=Rhizobium leguminosarum TaxID=384 RepID=A0A7X0DRE6_RHILE|nr:hypothetical protein [Rhizobium leguminosarum]MBB6219554.1 hypothetical protein [Rhizobium leguminosarum]